MARDLRPGETGRPGPERVSATGGGDEDLERRRARLEARLAERRPASRDGKDASNSSGTTGFGTAVKLASEFVAGIAVGAGIGLVIDHWAGTSPWGLIVFLLLGFAAGVVNVLRSAGMMAGPGQGGGKPADPEE
jgi:ATP synthase protein I